MSGDLEARFADLEAQLQEALEELKQVKEKLAKTCQICGEDPAEVCQGCFEAFLKQVEMNKMRVI